MQTTGNTILITGGGSGIGRALAESFYKLGNHVIIAGRRQQVLDEATAANPGMASILLDIEDAASLPAFAQKLTGAHPAFNAVIHNAGIMRRENLLHPSLADSNAIISTNLLGPIHLTAALLPHLQQQPNATIMTVSSGLAFMPMSTTPTYCATKAAIHSWTQSLRFQLRNTRVEVLELVPPYVQTGLMGAQQATDPRAMPLDKFITEVMDILKTQPNATEILVETVKPLRFAEKGNFEAFYKNFNEAIAANPH